MPAPLVRPHLVVVVAAALIAKVSVSGFASQPRFESATLDTRPLSVDVTHVASKGANGVNVGTARADTAITHKLLRAAIEEFQDKWRGKWQSVELKRHRPMQLNDIRGYNVRADGIVEGPFITGDRERGNMTPELRRYLQIICYAGTPTDKEIEEAKWNASRLEKQITRSEAGAERLADVKAAGIERRTRAEAATAAGLAADKEPPPPSSRMRTRDPNLPDPRPAGATDKPLTTMKGGVNAVSTRMIVSLPNTGSICPSWLPAEEGVPLDEGEAIDFAIPVKERPPLKAQRDKLIGILDAAQKQDPTDTWITGQRVRFLFDQRDLPGALATATDCLGDRVWCLSLQGSALQHLDDIAGAEKAFRQADAQSPAKNSKDAGCGISEALLLLNHDDRDVVRNKSCEEQNAIVDRMWWLADPLWSVPGNERYVAHNVRKTEATLRAVTDRDERYIWSDKGGGQAMHELVIRYGWPSYTYWSGRQLDDEMNKFREYGYEKNQFRVPPYTAKEYSTDRTALLPSGKALIDPFKVTQDDWQLYSPTADIESWWPQEHFYYQTRIATLKAGQDVMWRRDTLVSYQLVIDDPLRNLDTATKALSKAMLMGGDGPATTRALATTGIGEGFTLRLGTSFPSSPLVMSAEILPRTLLDRAMRRRYAVQPPPTLRDMKAGDVALSDPVVMRMPNRTMAVPTDQQNVLRYMAGDLTFVRDEPLALYWESYGFQPGDTLDVELKFRHVDEPNVAQRLLGAVGIGGSSDSVSIKWTEPDLHHAVVILGGAKPTVGRSVAVDLTALQGGTYVLSMEMRKGKTVSARSERRIVVK